MSIVGRNGKIPGAPFGTYSDEKIKLLLEFAIDYIRVQTDALEECHMHPDTKEVEGDVVDEIRENREWIRKAEAAIK